MTAASRFSSTASVGRLWRTAVSCAGFAIFAVIAAWGIAGGKFVTPIGGDIPTIFQPAGDALRAGQPVYVWKDLPFFYAPPMVVLLAAISWMPTAMLFTAVVAMDVASLRYIGGSWLRVGYLLWFVVVPFEFAGGQLNILMAAVIVAAIRRGWTGLPALLSFAKISPVLAVDPRKWRRFAVWGILLIAITLPWWWLWPEWIAQLGRGWQTPVGPQIPIPFLLRLPVGLALVATRTRLGRAAGAVIATPAFYWGSLVLLLAPAAICFDLADERRRRTKAGNAGASGDTDTASTPPPAPPRGARPARSWRLPQP
jgi:hypothetical protein